jgi:hypothetical protein
VLHRGIVRAFVEFEFYIHSIRYDPLSGKKCGMKGGPGRKNFREFRRCVEGPKRRRAPSALKLVVLFYFDPDGSTGNRRYDADYGNHRRLQKELGIPLTLRATEEFRANGSDCNARLYEVA